MARAGRVAAARRARGSHVVVAGVLLVLVAAVIASLLVTPAEARGQPPRAPKAGGIGRCAESRRQEVRQIAEWAVSEYNKRLAKAGKPPVKLLRVVSARCQVVAGTLYYIKVRLLKAKGKTPTKTFKVWDQPWVPHREIINRWWVRIPTKTIFSYGRLLPVLAKKEEEEEDSGEEKGKVVGTGFKS
ncbi:hypothetical protein CBR_g40714 [Chara braunii]|uniref:Cysteine proteinase inhibitor n=1 Tax=Chara braunii TaxID=69332 RepID=A0A388LUG7_CHABU|nr:hypothetical protein CBR_g40714 [Chara braunii]|eukprot:GBG85901.1 hypothetical protein CBR_g40714 [Chara braunii]